MVIKWKWLINLTQMVFCQDKTDIKIRSSNGGILKLDTFKEMRFYFRSNVGDLENLFIWRFGENFYPPG